MARAAGGELRPARRRLAALSRIAALDVRHQERSTASALLLAGWLASRLDWERAPLASDASARGLRGRATRGTAREVELCAANARAGGAGARRRHASPASMGTSLSLQRGAGGLDAQERLPTAVRASGSSSGASRGEGGILGEGVSQALLRDPTYGPALARRRELCPAMTLEIEVVEDPARAAAAMMVSAALGGGQIVLAGGSTPTSRVRAVRRGGPRRSASICRGPRFWIGDERCVAPDDDRSQLPDDRASRCSSHWPESGAARRSTGSGASWAPSRAADDYERQLRDAGPPRFDLVLLGIGPDGHTGLAVSRPGSLSERSRLVVGVPRGGSRAVRAAGDADRSRRLTASQMSCSWPTGASKADAVAAAFGPDAKPDPHVPVVAAGRRSRRRSPCCSTPSRRRWRSSARATQARP